MGETEKIITMEPVEKKRKSKKVEGVVIDEVSGEGSGKESGKKERKEKKRKEWPEGAAVEEAGQDEEKDEKKKRKKRITEGGEDINDLAEGSSRVLTEDNNIADEARKEKKKKKRDVKQDTKDDIEAEPTKDGNSKKDKRRRKGKDRDEGSETSSPVVLAEDISSKKGSKKRKEKKDEGERITDGSTEDATQKKKKRRKHNNSGFPDPEGDDALSEQAKKVLSYAYLQAEEPSSWKFNKARQNWLLRNVWSDEAISDTHVPLANKYLAGVQGGVRETLVKTCQDILTAKPAPEVKTAEGEVQNETVDTKKTVSFDISDAKEESDTAAATLAMKQKRAQGLLGVLLASGTVP